MLQDMKRSLICLTCLALSFVSVTIFAKDLTSVEMASRLDEITIVIKTNDSITHEGGIGSGFFVHPRYIATNFHVIKGASARDILYKRVDKSRFRKIKSIRAIHPQRDLAILEVAWTPVKLSPIGDSDSAKKGEPIYVSGNPKGLEGTFSDGKISAIRKDFSIKVLQISAPISRGSSGGPILNLRGEVIGIATWIRRSEIQLKSEEIELDVPQNLNFAVPSNYLKSLLKRHHIPLPPPIEPEPEDSDEKAKVDAKKAVAEKAEADVRKAEADARKVEAEAKIAEAEAEKAQAEAKKADAERAKAEAEKAKAEATIAEAERTESEEEAATKSKVNVAELKARIADRLQAATVLIFGRDRNGNEGLLGSGFFVREDQVATDFHVIDGSTLKKVRRLGKGMKTADSLFDAQLLKTDKTHHLAILQVKGADVQPLHLANSKEVDIDEKISMFGDPSRGEFSEGKISKILNEGGVPFL